MAKVLREISLDLQDDEVQGYESSQDLSKIINYTHRNFTGEHAPRVGVVKRNGVYQLCFGTPEDSENYFNSGGHNRSISHDISGHRLECYLMDEHRKPESAEHIDFKSIKDTKIGSLLSPNDFYLRYLNYSFKDKLRIFSDSAIRKFVAHHKFNARNSERLYEFLVKLKTGCSVADMLFPRKYS